MGQQWYYSRGGSGAQLGPVEVDGLRQLIAAGPVTADDVVWTDGMPEWQRAANIPLFFAPVPEAQGFAHQPYGAPHRVGLGNSGHRAAGDAGMLNYQSSPYFRPEYAGFWLRFCAWFVDRIVLYLVTLPISFALGINPFERQTNAAMGLVMLNTVIEVVIEWLYFAFQESSSFSATLGKRAVGIMVTDARGERISFARATGRYFGKYVSALILLIGFIMAAFTRQKQALHDLMADCLVVKRR